MKKAWTFTYQMLTLLVIYLAGNYLADVSHLRIPGNVIGIVILLVLLWLRIVKIEQIEIAAGWLLKHLGFFFIPISVGLMTLGHFLLKSGLLILIILMSSAFIGLLSAGKVTQTAIQKKERVEVKYHDNAM
jgi:holin-like protein